MKQLTSWVAVAVIGGGMWIAAVLVVVIYTPEAWSEVRRPLSEFSRWMAIGQLVVGALLFAAGLHRLEWHRTSVRRAAIAVMLSVTVVCLYLAVFHLEGVSLQELRAD